MIGLYRPRDQPPHMLTKASSSLPQRMLKLATEYNDSVQEESKLSEQELKTRHVGKQDPKRHLEEEVEGAMGRNIVQTLCAFLCSRSP